MDNKTTMNILAVGASNAGKTCFFQYARALFATSKEYKVRKSPIAKHLSLAKVERDGKMVEPDFHVERGYAIQGTSRPKISTFTLAHNDVFTIGGRFSLNIMDISFVDVQGGLYDDFKQNKLQSGWDSEIVRALGNDKYNALMIIIQGDEFVRLCEEAQGYEIQNIVTCATKISEQKHIPAFIIITHADLMSPAEINNIEKTLERILKYLKNTNIDYYFVNIKESIGRDTLNNSHLLKTPLSRFAQIPFLKSLREFVRGQLNSTPSKKGLVIATIYDRYISMIKTLDKHIDELSEEYRRAKAWEWIL